jgi:hypothetical protein
MDLNIMLLGGLWLSFILVIVSVFFIYEGNSISAINFGQFLGLVGCVFGVIVCSFIFLLSWGFF